MTVNEMRAAIREQCRMRAISLNGLESTGDEPTVQRLYHAFCGAGSGQTHANEAAHSGTQFVVNDAERAALAARVKASIDTPLTVNDLAKLPVERLQELVRQNDWASYSINDLNDEAGKTLRAVTALKNAVQSAMPSALVTLGLATLEGWRQQVEKAVAATSASVARNEAMPYAMGLPRAGEDKYAGYSLNVPADEFAGYDMNNAGA